jgi:hypothetical protein
MLVVAGGVRLRSINKLLAFVLLTSCIGFAQLDTSKWASPTAITNAGSDQCARSSQIDVTGGLLTLTTANVTSTCAGATTHYNIAIMFSKPFKFSTGVVKIRAKMAPLGVHSAFWLWGGSVTSSGYPDTCLPIILAGGTYMADCTTNSTPSWEVDMVEVKPSTEGVNFNATNIHQWQSGSITSSNATTHDLGFDTSADYHTYTFSNTGTAQTYTADGVTTQTYSVNLTGVYFEMQFDAEVDTSGGTGSYPITQNLDYVHACSDPTATCDAGDPTMVFQDEFTAPPTFSSIRKGATTTKGTTSSTSTTFDPYLPAMPTGIAQDGSGTVMNTEYPASASGYTVVNVAGGANLQTAIDAAACGTIIKVAHGSTFTGAFHLPAKTPACTATTQIIIQSDDCASDGSCTHLPAPHSRVCADAPTTGASMATYTCADASYMAKLVPVNDAQGCILAVKRTLSQNNCANAADSDTKFYRFGPGIELTTAGVATIDSTGFIGIMLGQDYETDWTHAPTDIVLDRIYMHGGKPNTTGQNIHACTFMASGSRIAMIDSYLGECHNKGGNEDYGLVFSPSLKGPTKIVNNRIDAAGINAFLGIVYLDNMVDKSWDLNADVEFRGNYVWKNWPGLTSVGATYTVLSSDMSGVNLPNGKIVRTGTSGATITLPQAGTTGFEANKSVVIDLKAGPASTVIITPAAGTIDGSASKTLTVPGGDGGIRACVISDGTNWTTGCFGAGWAGVGYFAKNMFETKTAHRMLIESNIFDYAWAEGQTAQVVLKSSTEDPSCYGSRCNTKDLTMRYNVMRHAGEHLAGPSAANYQFNGLTPPCRGRDGAPGETPNHALQWPQRFWIHDNIGQDSGGSYTAPGSWDSPEGSATIVANSNICFQGGISYVRLQHNTWSTASSPLFMSNGGTRCLRSGQADTGTQFCYDHFIFSDSIVRTTSYSQPHSDNIPSPITGGFGDDGLNGICTNLESNSTPFSSITGCSVRGYFIASDAGCSGCTALSENVNSCAGGSCSHAYAGVFSSDANCLSGSSITACAPASPIVANDSTARTAAGLSTAIGADTSTINTKTANVVTGANNRP